MRVYIVLHRLVIDGHSMGPKVCSTTQILITMEATKPCTAHPGFADVVDRKTPADRCETLQLTVQCNVKEESVPCSSWTVCVCWQRPMHHRYTLPK
jgi:hypothetical protein